MSLQHIHSCFNAFDKDDDGYLNFEEFNELCKALFRNDRGIVYGLRGEILKQVFECFDFNYNGLCDLDEFVFCWYNWFKYIIHPRSVCVVVNMQNDYVSGPMALAAINDEDEELPNILEPINIVLATCEFEKVFYIVEWHPSNHISFYENVGLRPMHPTSHFSQDDAKLYDTVVFAVPTPIEQKLWPKHCVENTWGSELHMDLRISSRSTKIYTGSNSESDQFSAFRDSCGTVTGFQAELQKLNITDVYVIGIAYDLCVRETCLDALSRGYRTILVEDCCRAIDSDVAANTKQEIISKNGVVVHSQHVKNMIEGKDRRPELGYMLALRIKEWAKKKERRTSVVPTLSNAIVENNM